MRAQFISIVLGQEKRRENGLVWFRLPHLISRANPRREATVERERRKLIVFFNRAALGPLGLIRDP